MEFVKEPDWRIYEEMRKLVKENPEAVALFLDEEALERFELDLMEKCPWRLKSVIRQTPAVIRAALEKDGRLLRFVAEQTPEWCELAVDRNPWALAHVMPDLRTPELCEKAVARAPETLQLIEPDRKTPELCEMAVSKAPYVLRFVEPDLQTPAVIRAALEKDGRALEHVAEQTPEWCELAVGQHSGAIHLVEDRFFTPEVCDKAVGADPCPSHLYPLDGWKEQMIRDAWNRKPDIAEDGAPREKAAQGMGM